MLKFKRLSDLSKDEKVIVEALKQSKAGLLEARTAYAKGFNKESSTLDELIEYYNESNPDVVSIQMRNYCEKKGKDKVWKFKGSIFLTFKTEEAAKTFVEKEEKYKDGALLKKRQRKLLWRRRKEMDEKRNKFGKNKDKKPKAEGAEGKEEAEVKQEEEFTLPKGSVLKLTGLGGEITRG